MKKYIYVLYHSNCYDNCIECPDQHVWQMLAFNGVGDVLMKCEYCDRTNLDQGITVVCRGRHH